jgi:WD40 repeat protein
MSARACLLIVATAAMAASLSSQSPPPDTDIFLASFALDGGKAVVGKPVNITANAGYDNQPSFTPDGDAILFTSVRGGRKPDPKISAASGSDIYRYDIASARVAQVTDTPESEYSPTVTPDGRHVSVIRVEADGTQRLWRFTIDGRDPSLVLPDVKPVGYHAWIDGNTLALFVLGSPGAQGAPGSPATLQVADVKSGRAEIVVKGIGRSIQRIPRGGVSFVLNEPRDGGRAALRVMELDPQSRSTTPLVPVVDGATQADLAWTPGGVLLMAHEGSLYAWRRGGAAMTPVADLSALGLRGVTRMAVSPKGDRIALVAQGG